MLPVHTMFGSRKGALCVGCEPVNIWVCILEDPGPIWTGFGLFPFFQEVFERSSYFKTHPYTVVQICLNSLGLPGRFSVSQARVTSVAADQGALTVPRKENKHWKMGNC